jgi:hypothetical protein
LQTATIFSENMIRQRKSPRGWALVTWIFTALNVVALVNDVMSYRKVPNSYFLAALILRAIFIPISVLLNAVVPFGFYCKDVKIRWVMRLSTILALLSIITAIVVGVAVSPQLYRWQVTELASPSSNWNSTLEFDPGFDVCRNSRLGLSLVDLAGFALGPYQRGRDAVADAQMQHFFGANWKADFDVTPLAVELKHLSAWGSERTESGSFPFDVVTQLSTGERIVAFRGFSSSAEFAFQLELIATKYLMPVVEDLLPFYGLISEHMLGYFLQGGHLFGYYFFRPIGYSDAFVEPIRDALEAAKVTKAVFVGFNTGGVLAKLLGATSRNPGIGLWGLPLFLPHLEHRWELETIDSEFTTTVSNQGGLFAIPENGEGVPNLGIPWVSIGLLEHDTILQSLCTLAEMCGQHPRLGEFCGQVIGADKVEKIRAELGERLLPQLIPPSA